MSETPAGFTRLVLVPVEVFGTNSCCTHGEFAQYPECKSTGYGLSDAVQFWSDCNRAIGRIYRVDDLDGPREPGESVSILVRDEDVEWFTKRWGEAEDSPQRRHVQDAEQGERS